ncbi:putative nucleolar GTP-binding protein 1, partial [Clarias magur]
MERSRLRARRVSHKLGKSINNPISDTQTASPEGLNSVSRALCVPPSTDQSDSPLQSHSPIRFSKVSLSEKGDFSTIRHAAIH